MGSSLGFGVNDPRPAADLAKPHGDARPARLDDTLDQPRFLTTGTARLLGHHVAGGSVALPFSIVRTASA